MNVRLWIRVSERDPPGPDGDLPARLAALRAHAAACRWVPLVDLTDPAAALRGSGPRGLRIGAIVEEGPYVFARHPAPGELAATVGPGPEDLAPFLRFLAGGLAGGARLEAHGEQFVAWPRGDGLIVRQIAPEGEVEDEVEVPRAAFAGLGHDRDALARLPATPALAEAAARLDDLPNAPP